MSNKIVYKTSLGLISALFLAGCANLIPINKEAADKILLDISNEAVSPSFSLPTKLTYTRKEGKKEIRLSYSQDDYYLSRETIWSDEAGSRSNKEWFYVVDNAFNHASMKACDDEGRYLPATTKTYSIQTSEPKALWKQNSSEAIAKARNITLQASSALTSLLKQDSYSNMSFYSADGSSLKVNLLDAKDPATYETINFDFRSYLLSSYSYTVKEESALEVLSGTLEWNVCALSRPNVFEWEQI